MEYIPCISGLILVVVGCVIIAWNAADCSAERKKQIAKLKKMVSEDSK